MFPLCIMIMFRSSGNRIFNGSLGCVCSFPSFEEWEEQKGAGQRAKVTAAAAAVGKDCVKVFTGSVDHRPRLVFPVLSYGALPRSGSDITQTQTCIYPTTPLPDIISAQSHFTWTILFTGKSHHCGVVLSFYTSSRWEQWDWRVSVRGKHYSSSCWHTPFLNHRLQTPRSINCWKYWRGSRDLAAATTRKYM